MNQELIRKQQDLTARLNRYRHEYYNLNAPSISDAVYDRLFEELQDLERQTGIQMANSPTSTVGYRQSASWRKPTIQSRCCRWIRKKTLWRCAVSWASIR